MPIFSISGVRSPWANFSVQLSPNGVGLFLIK